MKIKKGRNIKNEVASILEQYEGRYFTTKELSATLNTQRDKVLRSFKRLATLDDYELKKSEDSRYTYTKPYELRKKKSEGTR